MNSLHEDVTRQFDDVERQRIADAIREMTLSREPTYHGKMRRRDVDELKTLHHTLEYRRRGGGHFSATTSARDRTHRM